MRKIITLLLSWLHQTTVPTPVILKEWRVRILNNILRGMLGLGLLAVMSGSWNVLQHLSVEQPSGALLNVLFYLLAYGMLGIITFGQRLGYPLRAGIMLLLLYLLGVIDSFTFGLSSDGRIFFFACIALTAVLFDIRRTIIAVTVISVTMALLATLLVTTPFAIPIAVRANANTPMAWISSIVVFLLLLSTVIIPLTYLLRELSQSLATTQTYARQLAATRNDLAAEVVTRTAALQASEERYRAISELTSDYIYTARLEADGVFVLEWISDAFTRTTGYTLEELQHKHGWQQLVHPDDWLTVQEHFQFLLHGQTIGMEYRIVSKEGVTRWLHNRARPEFDATQRVVRILGAAQDITERKRADEASHFQAHLLDLVDQAVIAIDSLGVITYWNRSAEELFGWSAGEALKKPALELGPTPETKVRALSMMAHVMRGANWSGEMSIVRRDGSSFPALVSCSPIVDTRGTVQGAVNVIIDITERKQMEESLRASEQKFRSFVEQSIDGIVLCNEQGDIVVWNQGLEQLSGITYAEAVDRPLWELLHQMAPVEQRTPAAYAFTRHAFQELFRNGQAAWLGATQEHTIQHPDGSRRVVQTRGFPMLTDAGFMAGTIIRDVTERKQIEEALKVSHQHINDILESISDAFFALDHEQRFTYVNQQAANLLQRERADLLGNYIWDEFTAAVDTKFFTCYQQVRTTQVAMTFEEFYPPLATWFEVHVYPSITGFSAYFRNINERKQSEAALQQANAHLTHWVRELEQRTREITLLREMGDLLHACRTAEEAYAVIGQMATELFPTEAGALYIFSASRTLLEAVATWGSVPMQRLTQPDECWSLRRGRIHLAQDTRTGLCCQHLPVLPPTCSLCIPMMAQSETLGVFHLCREQGNLSEATRQLAATVTEHIALALATLKLQETLRHQAIRDPLTGLFNRRYMEEALERELRRTTRYNTLLGIIMFDLDHFKRFNDTFGHAAGDTVLRELGVCLRNHIRGEDLASRYGGEEFMLILLDTTPDDVQQRAEQVRSAVSRLQVQYREQSLGAVTISLGIAFFPTHGSTVEELVHAADTALYRAKAAGRDCVVIGENLRTSDYIPCTRQPSIN